MGQQYNHKLEDCPLQFETIDTCHRLYDCLNLPQPKHRFNKKDAMEKIHNIICIKKELSDRK